VSVIIENMNYYGAKDLASSFRTVRKNTIQIAEEIPEDKYGFQPAPGTRTVAQTLVHIANAPRFNYQVLAVEKRLNMEGFDFAKMFAEMTAEEHKQRTKAEIISLLDDNGKQFAQWLETVGDEFLGQVVTFPQGAQPSRSRFDMLLGTKEHEMHHRAQLMLVERMLGITPHLTRQMQERMAAMQRGHQAHGA
jgi:uncharacterized damage-inducible protein DinB